MGCSLCIHLFLIYGQVANVNVCRELPYTFSVPSDGYPQSQQCSVLTFPIVQPRLNSTLSWRITCKSYSLRCLFSLFTTTAFCICHYQRHNRISPGERSTPGDWTLMRPASHGCDDVERQTLPSLLTDGNEMLSLFSSLAQPTFLANVPDSACLWSMDS